MNRTFSLQADAVATLVLINHAVYDIVEAGGVDLDILDELSYLQPQLQAAIDGLKEESPLHRHPTKSAV